MASSYERKMSQKVWIDHFESGVGSKMQVDSVRSQGHTRTHIHIHTQATLLRVGAAALRAPRVAQRTARAPLAGLRCSAGVQAWLAENGGKSMCSSSVAGLVATTDLKAGEEACSVSIKSCFTAVIMN